jgi:hypothetical protein
MREATSYKETHRVREPAVTEAEKFLFARSSIGQVDKKNGARPHAGDVIKKREELKSNAERR